MVKKVSKVRISFFLLVGKPKTFKLRKARVFREPPREKEEVSLKEFAIFFCQRYQKQDILLPREQSWAPEVFFNF